MVQKEMHEDGRRKTGDGRRETEDGRRKTGDGRRETEDGRWKTGDGRRETEDGILYPVNFPWLVLDDEDVRWFQNLVGYDYCACLEYGCPHKRTTPSSNEEGAGGGRKGEGQI
jgi:hypothetical protein